jgi:hypothetical protein
LGLRVGDLLFIGEVDGGGDGFFGRGGSRGLSSGDRVETSREERGVGTTSRSIGNFSGDVDDGIGLLRW